MGGVWRYSVPRINLLTSSLPFKPGEYKETGHQIITKEDKPNLMNEWEITAIHIPVGVYATQELAAEGLPEANLSLKLYINRSLVYSQEEKITFVPREGEEKQHLGSVTFDNILQQSITLQSRQNLAISVGLVFLNKINISSVSIATCMSYGVAVPEPGELREGSFTYEDIELSGHRRL